MSPFEHADFALGQGGKYWKKNYTGLGGGGTQSHRVYPFIYHFGQKRYPFHTPFIDKWYPLFILFILPHKMYKVRKEKYTTEQKWQGSVKINRNHRAYNVRLP